MTEPITREYQRHICPESAEALIKKVKEWVLYSDGLVTDYGETIVSFPCMRANIEGLEVKLESTFKRRSPTIDIKLPIIGFGTKYNILVSEQGVVIYSDYSKFAKRMFDFIHQGGAR